MSSRPAGPSTRPFQQQFSFNPGRQSQHVYEPLLPTNLPFQNTEPPRLRERGPFSRCFCCLTTLACLGFTAFLLNNLLQQIPSETFGATFVTTEHVQVRHQLKQKSIMKRLAMLKRSESGNGVDLSWTRQLFPYWFTTTSTQGDVLDTQVVLSDLVLAVSFLTQSELDEETPLHGQQKSHLQ